jgi:hypothetical protein
MAEIGSQHNCKLIWQQSSGIVCFNLKVWLTKIACKLINQDKKTSINLINLWFLNFSLHKL